MKTYGASKPQSIFSDTSGTKQKNIKQFHNTRRLLIGAVFVGLGLAGFVTVALFSSKVSFENRSNADEGGKILSQGYFGVVDCSTIDGWVWQMGVRDKSIDIHLYTLGADGQGKFVTGATANLPRPDVAASVSQDNGKHGFRMITPKELKDGQEHTLIAYGYDPITRVGGEPLLNSPVKLRCNPESPAQGGQGSPTKILMLPNQTNFPIGVSRATKQFEYECNSDGSANVSPQQYMITQQSNTSEQSLCKDSNRVSDLCPGADLAKESSTMRSCYWSSQRRVLTSVNAANMPSRGCLIHADAYNRANPGGYANHLLADYTAAPDFWGLQSYSLKNMSQLWLDLGVRLSDYGYEACAPGLVDRVTKTTTPVAQTILGLIFTAVDPITKKGSNTVFYQLQLYDSRDVFRTAEHSKNVDCSLSSSVSGASSFILIDNSLVYYGQKYPEIGGQPVSYSLNLMPQIIEGIKKCQGENADLSKYQLTSMFVGTEAMNGARLTSEFIDPKLSIVR